MVNARITYEGKPLSVLNNLIEQRQKLLGETVKDAVVATAITVLKSLRADTKVAPKKARPSSYQIEDTGWYGGWERVGGKFHRVVRATINPKSPRINGIFPVNHAGQKYIKGEVVKVYKITPVNDNVALWDKTKHKGCWYLFATNENVAKAFAARHMTRRIDRYRGLAKATLGFAMAAVSTKSKPPTEVKSAKSMKAAMNAAKVIKALGEGKCTITIIDLLNYSALALKSGAGAIERAMMKAANSISGRLSKVAGAKLGAKIPTPFPEVKG